MWLFFKMSTYCSDIALTKQIHGAVARYYIHNLCKIQSFVLVLLRPLVMLIGFQAYDICSVLLNNFFLLNYQWCNNTVLLYGAADEMHIDLQANSVHICREAVMPKIRHPPPLFSTVYNNGVSACLCLPSGLHVFLSNPSTCFNQNPPG